MLRGVHYGYKQDRTGITLNSKKSEGLSLLDLVPESVVRAANYSINEAIPVAPLPQNLGDDYKAFTSLFSQQHMLYINSHLLAETTTEHTQIRLWDRMMPGKSAQLPQAPPNMSGILKVAVQDYARNFDNMWSTGRMFHKALDRLLLLIFRFKLAPSREARYKQISEKYAKEKSAVKELNKARTPSSAQRRQKLKAEMKYYKKCLKKSDTSNEELVSKWLSRAHLSYQRLRTNYEAHKVVKCYFWFERKLIAVV